jgi:polyamine oxidase
MEIYLQSYHHAQGTYTKIYLQFPKKFWFDTEVRRILPIYLGLTQGSQFGLYADHKRGWYPVWQSLDMDGFFPGSGILLVTVTVRFGVSSPVVL